MEEVPDVPQNAQNGGGDSANSAIRRPARPSRAAIQANDLLEPIPDVKDPCWKQSPIKFSKTTDIDRFIDSCEANLKDRNYLTVVTGTEDPFLKQDGNYYDTTVPEEAAIVTLIYKKDEKAFELIMGCICEEHRQNFADLHPNQHPNSDRLFSRELWKRIHSVFNRKDPETAQRYLKELVNLEKDPSESVAEHLAKRVRIQNKILSAEVSLQTIFLLLTLDVFGREEKFVHTQRSILEQSMKELEEGGLEAIKSKLELAESRTGNGVSGSAFSATNRDDACLNGCGGFHKYWLCPKPLKPDLQKRKDKFEEKKRRRQENKKDFTLEKIEAQITQLQNLAKSLPKDGKPTGSKKVTFSVIAQPQKQTSYNFGLMGLLLISLGFLYLSLVSPFANSESSFGLAPAASAPLLLGA